MSKTISLLTVAALLLGSAQAHIALSSPAPFSPKPDTSPLSGAGTDFPCKKSAGGQLAVNSVTTATVGQPMQLSFSGTANHGGGSCQISLTTDNAAQLSANSQFKVIYSIMGGCPGVNGADNTYSVNIPKEVPSGNYTLAWTWYNNIGNREIYMNCAPMSISGGSASASDFSRLPDMAVYNVASKNDCHTIETKDVQFPNPGKYVLTGANFKPAPPTGSCATGSAAAIAPGTNIGGGSVSSGSSGSSGSGSSPAAYDDGQYHPKSSAAASMKNATPTTLATSVAAAPSSKAAPTGTAPASSPSKGANGIYPPGGFIGAKPGQAPPAPAPSGPAPAPVAGKTCSPDGILVCSPDGTQFGLCNFGNVFFMPVAAGTKCANGAIAGRKARSLRL